MTDSVRWFPGDEAPTEQEQAFLWSLRAAASFWDLPDLQPGDTSTRREPGRLVEIRVPLLTTPRRILRVGYDTDDTGLPTLNSEWTPFAYAFDGGPEAEAPDPEGGLWVTGVEATPEQCGHWTAAWFERQLRRPVKRREWDRPRSGPATLIPGSGTEPALVRWTLDRPAQELDSSGGLRWWWLEHRPPSREIIERHGSPPAP